VSNAVDSGCVLLSRGFRWLFTRGKTAGAWGWTLTFLQRQA